MQPWFSHRYCTLGGSTFHRLLISTVDATQVFETRDRLVQAPRSIMSEQSITSVTSHVHTQSPLIDLHACVIVTPKNIPARYLAYDIQ